MKQKMRIKSIQFILNNIVNRPRTLENLLKNTKHQRIKEYDLGKPVGKEIW